MTDKIAKSQGNKAPSRAAELREARLKAALKANMARRKTQAKQRGAEKNVADLQSCTLPDVNSGTEPQPDVKSGTDIQPDASSGAQEQPGVSPGTERE